MSDTPRTDVIEGLAAMERYGHLHTRTDDAMRALATAALAAIAHAEKRATDAEQRIAKAETARAQAHNDFVEQQGLLDDAQSRCQRLLDREEEFLVAGERAAATARENAAYAGLQLEALQMARRVLHRWAESYAEWSQANGHMEALMDRRLPPADHVKALEAIADVLAKSPTFVAVDEGKPGGDKTVEVHGHAEGGKLVIDEVIEREPDDALTGQKPECWMVTWGGPVLDRAYCDSVEAAGSLKTELDENGWLNPTVTPLYVAPRVENKHDGCNGLDTPERVRFYEHDFYVLSNFSAFKVEYDGHCFDTAEAAYHFQKFPNSGSARREIIFAPSAHHVFKYAEAHKAQRRPDWNDVKVDIMRCILAAKASQHEYVRRKLLATGERELVEDSWRDDFWGWGPNRDGQNMLGKLWMQVRAELRRIENSTPEEARS